MCKRKKEQQTGEKKILLYAVEYIEKVEISKTVVIEAENEDEVRQFFLDASLDDVIKLDPKEDHRESEIVVEFVLPYKEEKDKDD